MIFYSALRARPHEDVNLATELHRSMLVTVNSAKHCGEGALELARDLALLDLTLLPEDAARVASTQGPDDAGTLVQAAMLTVELNDLQVARGISTVNRMQLMNLTHDVNVTLPFDEAERDWVVDQTNQAVDIFGEHAPEEILEPFGDELPRPAERLVRRRGAVLSAGLTKQMDGREALDRWSRWRRGLGEFEGEPTIERTIERLQRLADFLLTHNLPRNW